MNKTTKSLYVIAERYNNSNISLFSEDVYESKEAADAVAIESKPLFARAKLEVMNLEDYIQEYGDNRYDEGASNVD